VNFDVLNTGGYTSSGSTLLASLLGALPRLGIAVGSADLPAILEHFSP
jgi:hypothetical protein